MTVEIISQSISTKVWDQTGMELAIPGLAVGLHYRARWEDLDEMPKMQLCTVCETKINLQRKKYNIFWKL